MTEHHSKGFRTRLHTPLLTDLGLMVGGSQKLMNMYGGQSKRGGFIAKLIRQNEDRYDDVDPSQSKSVRDREGNMKYKLDRSTFLLNRMGREPTAKEKRWQESKDIRLRLSPVIDFTGNIPTTEEQDVNDEIVRERVGQLQEDAKIAAQQQRLFDRIEDENVFGFRKRVKEYIEILGAELRNLREQNKDTKPLIRMVKKALKVLFRPFTDGEKLNVSTGRVQKILPNGVVYDDFELIEGYVKPKTLIKTQTDDNGDLIYKKLKYPDTRYNFGFPFIIDANKSSLWF